MTIAACYVSPEGVVLGADSTTTLRWGGGVHQHHYEYGQKVFEIGQGTRLGITMWGLGGLGDISYRTLIALLGDDLALNPPSSMQDVAERWSKQFAASFATVFAEPLAKLAAIQAKDPGQLTSEEAEFLLGADDFASGGFCIGGNCLGDRQPQAFELTYSLIEATPTIGRVDVGVARFWGVPNIIERLIYGVDFRLLEQIEASGKWSGTSEELLDLVRPQVLAQPTILPLREAIDWVHASIYATIKAMKFSHLAPVCGGPIEIAVITTDRPFRWVRHKPFDAAIGYVSRKEV